MDILPSAGTWLMETTLRGSILIFSIWLLRPFLRRWLGARATHLLWLVVLVQLLSPWLPQSPLSLLPKWTEHRLSGRAAAENEHVQISIRVAEKAVQSAVAQPPLAQPASLLPMYSLVIWALGSGAIIALALLRAVRASRLVSRAPDIGGRVLLQAALEELPDVPRQLRICETGELRSPALCGIVRPTILLPKDWAERFSAEELRCVLLHEIGHFRRGDLVWHWAFLIARAVHWFNPLVWLAERSARADQEMACDEWVLARSVSFNEQVYGEVLLKASRMLGTPRIASPLHATMAESKAGLTRRIRHLAQIRSHGWCAIATALILAVCLFAVAAPSRGQAETEGASSAADSPISQEKAVEVVPGQVVMERRDNPAPDQNKRPQIEIEARFVELSSENDQPSELNDVPQKILSAQAYERLITALTKRKGGGVDLLTAPRVTVPSGQQATIEIIREFRYPTKVDQATDGSGNSFPKEFETRNTGVTLTTTPEVLPDERIELVLAPEVVEFEGFVNYRANRPARAANAGDALSDLLEPVSAAHELNQPIFSRRKLTSYIVLKPGQTAMVGGMSRMDKQVVEEQGRPASVQSIKRDLYIFVTARPVTYPRVQPAVAQAQNEPQTTSSVPEPPPSGKKMAVAIPVPGKPGFVISPYAPKAGYVDLRGYPPGKEVQCPYSGKKFLTP